MFFSSYVASGFSALYCGPMGAATAGSSCTWGMVRSSKPFCSLSLYFSCFPVFFVPLISVGFETCSSVGSGEVSLINPLVERAL